MTTMIIYHIKHEEILVTSTEGSASPIVELLGEKNLYICKNDLLISTNWYRRNGSCGQHKREQYNQEHEARSRSSFSNKQENAINGNGVDL